MRRFFSCLLVALLAMAGALNAQSPRKEYFFSPKDDCTKEIVNRIDHAERKVLVQAYRFDSNPIAQALIRAKHERHVDVRVLLDTRHAADKGDVAAGLEAARIPTTTYSPPHGIDHNKFMVIDDIVITGSFNFTKQAQANAENLVITRDAAMAAGYAANWELCAAHSKAYVPAMQAAAKAAETVEKAAKAVAKAVEAAKTKAGAFAEAEAAWAKSAEAWVKAEKETEADAKSADPTIAKCAAGGLQVTKAAELASLTAETTAKAAKEAWMESATVEETWAEAETAWAVAERMAAERVGAGAKTAKEFFKSARAAFAKADAAFKVADVAWAMAEAKALVHKKAADDADAAVKRAEKAADAADAALKQSVNGKAANQRVRARAESEQRQALPGK